MWGLSVYTGHVLGGEDDSGIVQNLGTYTSCNASKFAFAEGSNIYV